MIAKYFPQEKEIRLYSQNNIDGDMGLISSLYRVLKKNSKRVVKT